MAKLSRTDVEYIRANHVRYQRGANSGPALAKRFGVDVSLIYLVLKGKVWK